MLTSRLIRSATGWLFCLAAATACGEPVDPPPADRWLTNTVLYSAPYDFHAATSNGFETLRAEVFSSRLKVVLSDAQPDTNHPPTLVFSVEPPGHWPSREWTARPMRWLHGLWECAVPVEDPDVPVVYFVQMDRNLTDLQSALRLCVPRLAGLEIPTQLFWPFLEGFESGASQWRLVAGPGESDQPELSTAARSGQHALRIELPQAGRSRTVTTTRVRGSVLEQRQATGIRLWMRAARSPAKARFTLIANADTAEQVVTPGTQAVELSANWRAVDVRFNAFSKLPIGLVDRFAIECISDTANECFVDDVKLLGPWNPDSP